MCTITTGAATTTATTTCTVRTAACSGAVSSLSASEVKDTTSESDPQEPLNKRGRLEPELGTAERLADAPVAVCSLCGQSKSTETFMGVSGALTEQDIINKYGTKLHSLKDFSLDDFVPGRKCFLKHTPRKGSLRREPAKIHYEMWEKSWSPRTPYTVKLGDFRIKLGSPNHIYSAIWNTFDNHQRASQILIAYLIENQTASVELAAQDIGVTEEFLKEQIDFILNQSKLKNINH
ncbi:hypothetical protein Pelo_4900 [Pelomyxa schiedti]|nr:hypothetical protein Pelo_4900 [Pelomyxa schiedti]